MSQEQVTGPNPARQALMTVASKSIMPRVAGQRREALMRGPAASPAPGAGERIRAGVADPGPVQVSARVAEQPARGPSCTACRRTRRRLRVSLAQRGGAGEAGEQDPDLGGIQRRRRLVTLLQRVEQLHAEQPGSPVRENWGTRAGAARWHSAARGSGAPAR